MSGRERAPWPGRALLGLLRGEGAESVRGDLEESYVRGVRGGRPVSAAAWVLDVALTVASWWNPGVVVRRRRLSRAARDGGSSRGPGLRARGGGSPGSAGWGSRDRASAWMAGSLMSDARQSLRGLRRRPGFSALVIATLGLGTGATTTIYSVVDAVVIRGLPYDEPEQLVAVGNLFPGREWAEGSELQAIVGVSGPNFRDWRERTHSFSALEAVELRSALFPDRGQGPEIVEMAAVTEGFLDALTAKLYVGRSFLPEDFEAAKPNTMLMSYGAWMQRTGGDPSVMGRALDGVGATVIGVLSPDFKAPEAIFGKRSIELWTPLDIGSWRYANRMERRLSVIGRLRPGVSLAAARQDLASVQEGLNGEFPYGNVYPDGTAFGAGLNGLQAQTVGGTGRTLVIFLVSSALLLLIAALNSANLLLVRGLDRQQEMAIRTALGASRWRVARVVLMESVTLAMCGGVLGILLAWGGVATFVRLVPATMPRLGEIAINGRILLVSALGSIAIGVAAGIVPALHQSGRNLALHVKAAGASLSKSGLRMRMSLVAAQLGLAVVLGVGASLLFRSFVNVMLTDPGFDADGVTTFSISLKKPGMERLQTWQMWDELLAEVEKVPGATSSAVSNVPFQSPDWAPAIQLRDDPPSVHRNVPAGYVVKPGYFELMRMRIIDGRGFDESDGPMGRRVVVVNRTFARTFFGTRSAVGERIRSWGDDGVGLSLGPSLGPQLGGSEMEIVGVVADAVQARVEDGPLPALYIPYTQATWPFVRVVVRSDREPGSLAEDLRAAARRFNPIVPMNDMDRMQTRIRDSRTEPRFRAYLFASFAAIAVLLAAIGLYGTLAHAVGRRTKELGIRMAVGADRRRIFAMVIGEGMRVFGAGLVLGIAGAVLTTRFLRGLLFGVGAMDSVTFAGTAMLLALIALLSILRPARRATAVDPMRSLRAE
jgi:putative ABC transport system permease protein